jgi:hypothetical protein
MIYKDEHSVSINASVRTPLYLKLILLTFLVGVVSFMLFILWPTGDDSFKTVLWLVCLFGTLTITTKSIRYSRDYGLLRLPPKVISFGFLATDIELVRQEGETEFGIMNFYDREEATRQLKPIFSTGVYLPLSQLKEVEDKLVLLFRQQEADISKWLSYSLN